MQNQIYGAMGTVSVVSYIGPTLYPSGVFSVVSNIEKYRKALVVSNIEKYRIKDRC